MRHRWGDQSIAPKATTVIEPIGGGAPKQSAARMQKEVRAQKGDRNYFRSPVIVFALTRRMLQLANIILSSSMIFSSV